MDRRYFIETLGMLGAAAWLPLSSFSLMKEPIYKMGLQLFTIRDDMENDPIGTLRAVKKMGYEDFEVYGFDPVNRSFYGYKAAEFKKILEDLDLTVSSGHFGFSPYLDAPKEELKRFTEACIVGAQETDMRYVTWPWIAPEQRTLDNFKRMAHTLNVIGEQVTSAGLGFAYHNHGFEFEDHHGENGFDIIVNETDSSLVKLQMDMYWVMHSSKFTPVELIRKHPGRFVMWHIKDMDKVTRDYTELGNGSIDYVHILPDPSASGLEFYYLEQGGNFASSPMESVADSARYFKKNLQKFL